MSGRFRRDFLYFFPLMKKTAVVFLLFFAAGSLRYSWFDADVSAFDGRSGESAELTGASFRKKSGRIAVCLRFGSGMRTDPAENAFL